MDVPVGGGETALLFIRSLELDNAASLVVRRDVDDVRRLRAHQSPEDGLCELQLYAL